ncbi:MAG: GNAT family N-acetyltransferase, partial [Candidatus Omnitrophica bacterium]|nr:GNAT family N-acetyltransferase [Candidatus Omnitrophota bacterium]
MKVEFEVREFAIGERRDAELLADMWNASDSGWPMGWTRGVPETAERILERTQKFDRIAIFVVEANGEILGYGDLERTRGRDDSAYLNLLNVRPDFHGKGLGKALILKILERTIEKGYKQLTIGTWGGNKKSVPLYKKTGFFWVPDTSVFMQNYIPTILGMPVAKEFFSKHDWYLCFKRELEAIPDDIEWNGIKVFPYRFEEDGEFFTVWIDNKAQAPTAIETDDLYIACCTGKEEIICGLEHKLRWEIANKKGEKPLNVTLIAQSENNIGLNVAENFTVDDRLVIEKTFILPSDIKPKEEGLAEHQIKSLLLINGVPLTLGTAVKPVQPIDIQFTASMFVSGKPNEKVVVNIKNNLDFSVNGELFIAPEASLKFDRFKDNFSIESKSWASFDFYLKINGEGAFSTKMQAVCLPEMNRNFISGNLPLKTKAKRVYFLTQPLDSVYSWYNEEGKVITVESPTIWVRVNLRGGDIEINERSRGNMVFWHRNSSLGPPFIDYEVPSIYEYRMEHKDGKIS